MATSDPSTSAVMSDPDAQLTSGECYVGWDIAEWCRWSITTEDGQDNHQTLHLVVSGRNEQYIRTVTTEQMRTLASYLTTLADFVDAERPLPDRTYAVEAR